MVFELINKEYKYTDCDKLNAALDEFISDLTFQSEGLSDNFMDIVMDHSNQKEREWDDLYNNPMDWLESILIKNQEEILESIIEKLNDIVFTEKPKSTKRMRGKEAMDWLIDEVKPLILNGVTKRKDIALHFNISEKTVRSRVMSAYHCNWREYVNEVLNTGRY